MQEGGEGNGRGKWERETKRDHLPESICFSCVIYILLQIRPTCETMHTKGEYVVTILTGRVEANVWKQCRGRVRVLCGTNSRPEQIPLGGCTSSFAERDGKGVGRCCSSAQGKDQPIGETAAAESRAVSAEQLELCRIVYTCRCISIYSYSYEYILPSIYRHIKHVRAHVSNGKRGVRGRGARGTVVSRVPHCQLYTVYPRVLAHRCTRVRVVQIADRTVC